MKKLLGGLIVLTILLGQYSCTHRNDVGLFREKVRYNPGGEKDRALYLTFPKIRFS